MASTATDPVLSRASETIANPLIAWHLLSLDAPTVATLWAWFVARAAGVDLPGVCCAAMFVAVWILYAADRLLDARCLGKPVRQPMTGPHRAAAPLELRHIFHHSHRSRFVPVIVLATIALLCMVTHLGAAALRLYMIEGALLLGWLAIVHGTHLSSRVPKEFVVGAFFAAAIFIPSVSRRPELRLVLLPAALVFAALCTLNCLFIHVWESGQHAAEPVHPVIAFAEKRLALLAGLELAAAAAIFPALPAELRALPIAFVLATLLLVVLHYGRARWSRTTLRAAADLVLLTPLLLLPFLA